MLLETATTSYVALAGAGAGVVSLAVALGLAARLARLRRAYAALAGDAAGEDVLQAMARHSSRVDALSRDIGGTRHEVEGLRAAVADTIRHVAVVRYDAFRDMGGRMSFSAALLDDGGDGLVLTSINGRSETRTYAKGVQRGQSEQTLSPEESEAVNYALNGAAPPRR